MKRYGLLGRTLKHSFSKAYFTKKFAELGLTDYSYDNFELAAATEFPLLLERHPDLCGVNVTIPYKEDVLAFLTTQNKIVQEIQACNCIKIDGKECIGFNTDVIGFQKSLEPQLQSHHTKALILGTGGASKAIAYVLQQLGINYHFVSRQKTANTIGYDEVDAERLASHHLIINTTPLGMFPAVDDAPALPYELLTDKHFLFDIIYNPATTKFLANGEKRGAQIANGEQMLIEQAEESWRIWKG